MCRLSWNLGASNFCKSQGLPRPSMGLLYPIFTAIYINSLSLHSLLPILHKFHNAVCLTTGFFFFFLFFFFFFFFFFFHWHYSPLWAVACRTMPFHFFLSATNCLLLLTPNTWRSLSTSSFHLFLGLPLLPVPSSSWVKIFLGILFSSILSRWPNQLIVCPFINFTIFSPLLISSSYRFVRLYLSPFPYLRPHILLNIFLSKINRLVLLPSSTSMLPLHTTLPVLLVSYIILVFLDKSDALIHISQNQLYTQRSLVLRLSNSKIISFP